MLPVLKLIVKKENKIHIHRFIFKAIQSLHDRASPYTYTLPQFSTPHSVHPNPCKRYGFVTHRSQAKELGEHGKPSDYTGKKAAQLFGELKYCKVTGKKTPKLPPPTPRIPDLCQASTRFSLEFQKAFRSAGALCSFHPEQPVQQQKPTGCPRSPRPKLPEFLTFERENNVGKEKKTPPRTNPPQKLHYSHPIRAPQS